MWQGWKILLVKEEWKGNENACVFCDYCCDGSTFDSQGGKSEISKNQGVIKKDVQ